MKSVRCMKIPMYDNSSVTSIKGDLFQSLVKIIKKNLQLTYVKQLLKKKQHDYSFHKFRHTEKYSDDCKNTNKSCTLGKKKAVVYSSSDVYRIRELFYKRKGTVTLSLLGQYSRIYKTF